MSSSLDELFASAGFDAASSSDRPKPPSPNPPFPLGFSLSLAEAGSALKVVPRTNGVEPRLEPSLGVELEGGNAVLLFDVSCEPKVPEPLPNALPPLPNAPPPLPNALPPLPNVLPPLPKTLWPLVLAPNGLGDEDGLEKMLPPPPSPPTDPKPPLLANEAKPPPVEGLAGAALPKTLPPVEAPVAGPAELENPGDPKAGAAPPAEALAHGETFVPRPPDCPNAAPG